MRETVLGYVLILLTSRQFQILRYFIGGVLVSLGYTATIVFMMEYLKWGNANVANLVSFVIWTPASYLLHQRFTFQQLASDQYAGTRFGITSLVKLVTSVLVVVLLTDGMGLHYLLAVLVNWFVLPLATFFVLKYWVFADGGGS